MGNEKIGLIDTKLSHSKRIFPVLEGTFFIVIYFILTPLFIYYSSPADFGGNAFTLTLFIFKNIILGVVVLFFLHLLFKKNKIFISKLLMIFTLLGITFGYIYQKNLGIMRTFKFVNESLLDITTATILIDLLIIIIISTLIFKYYLKLQEFLITFLAVITLSQLGILSVTIFEYNQLQKKENIENSKKIENIKKDLQNDFSFSKDKDNTVVLILDGFSGFILEEVFKENPEYKLLFDGFTWFPNTVASGSYTLPSMSSVIAGHQYEVDKLNEIKDKTYKEKYNDLVMRHSDFFKQEGYERTYFGIPFFSDTKALKNSGASKLSQGSLIDYRREYVQGFETDYAENAFFLDEKALSNIILRKRMLTQLTYFKMAPYLLKNIIYYNSFKSSTSTDIDENKTYGKYRDTDSLWSSFASLINTSQSSPTIKFIRTNAMVRPYHINDLGGPPIEEIKEGSFNSNGPQEAIFTVNYIFKRLFVIFEKLKELDVYNNTTIIIASDHGVRYQGSWHDSAINALLMIKEKNKTGEVNISNKLMSNADIYSITTSIASGLSDDIIQNPLENEAPRTVNYFATRHGNIKNLSENILDIDFVINISDSILGKYDWDLSLNGEPSAEFGPNRGKN